MSSVVGELDSGESIDAEAGLESDTILSLSWAVSLRIISELSSLPVREAHCTAARMRTCSRYGFSNHSLSLIGDDTLKGSSLWKPCHNMKSLANFMFGIAGGCAESV